MELSIAMVVSNYNSTFSGPVVIKLFLKNTEFSRNNLFEMLEFNEIIREGKIQRLVKSLEPLALSQSIVEPSIQ
jgi:hypothetical protein